VFFVKRDDAAGRCEFVKGITILIVDALELDLVGSAGNNRDMISLVGGEVFDS